VSAWGTGAKAEALDARILLVLGGALLAFLPPHYAGRWVDEGRLEEILPGRFGSANTFYVFFKKAERRSVAAAHLRRIILEAFAVGASDAVAPRTRRQRKRG
jgi:DNA-binding transcriptional LysR family regulator